MNLVSYPLRPAVDIALQHAVLQFPYRTNRTRIPASSDLVSSIVNAQALVLDLGLASLSAIASPLKKGLQQQQHVVTYVVPVALVAVEDQVQLFELARAGVSHMPTGPCASQSSYWTQQLHVLWDTNVLVAWRKQLYNLFAHTERGNFLRFIAEECSASSITNLVERLYREDYLTNSGKRRRLWRECEKHRLPHPELVWASLRLLLLKTLLDHNTWTLSRIASYLGYTNARQLSAMCKRRYAMTPSELRERGNQTVVNHVMGTLVI